MILSIATEMKTRPSRADAALLAPQQTVAIRFLTRPAVLIPIKKPGQDSGPGPERRSRP